jgi:hypothetical protein
MGCTDDKRSATHCVRSPAQQTTNIVDKIRAAATDCVLRGKQEPFCRDVLEPVMRVQASALTEGNSRADELRFVWAQAVSANAPAKQEQSDGRTHNVIGGMLATRG